MKFPHEGVYTRLKPSKLHGIGVFAIADIPIGTTIFSGDEETKTVLVDASEIEQLSDELKKLYLDFCPLNNNKYECPENFNQMPISWFLNSSKTPNVECRENLIFYASRNIDAGEELTVDYETYSD